MAARSCWGRRRLLVAVAVSFALVQHAAGKASHVSSRRLVLRAAAATAGLRIWDAGPDHFLRSAFAVQETLPLPQCDQAVDVLVGPNGRRVYMCGTAHISRESADLVRALIRTTRPDTVMVELDRARLESLFAKAAGAPKVEQRGGLGGFLQDLRGEGSLAERVKRAQANAIGRGLSNLYESMESLGFQSGEEFRVAVTEALNMGAKVQLGDQDVRVTLDSLRDALQRTDLRKLLTASTAEMEPSGGGSEPQQMPLLPQSDKLDRETVEQTVALLKERDNTRAVVALLKEQAPALHGALIAQRDAVMAENLRASPGRTVVAVVGMAHLDGIEKILADRDGMRLERPRECR